MGDSGGDGWEAERVVISKSGVWGLESGAGVRIDR